MDEQNTVTQAESESNALEQQAANPQTANEQGAATTSQDEAQPVADAKTAESETATVQVPAPSKPEANNQSNPSSLSFIAAVICGAIVAFIYLRWKKLHNLHVVTFEDVCQYAREQKKRHPQAASTMVTVVVDSTKQTTTLMQVILDKDGKPINQEKGNFAGRQFRIKDVDPKLKELMGDDIKCIIPIE